MIAKFCVLLLCIVVVGGGCIGSTSDCCLKQSRLALTGFCDRGRSAEDILPCRDLCSGEVITDRRNCNRAKHCCRRRGVCILKRPENFLEDAPVIDIRNAEVLLNLSLADNVNRRPESDVQDNQSSSEARTTTSGTYCVRYPNNCVFRPLSLVPRVNIPYCQRVACSVTDPSLNGNYIGCVTTPGCQFDYSLFRYRAVLNQAVLPNVPVCYKAIRNEAFLKRTNEFVQARKRKSSKTRAIVRLHRAHRRITGAIAYGSWNPLVEQCLLDEYKNEIFGDLPGCHMADILEYYGDSPKLAGWLGITSEECNLIGACYKSDGRCVYPVRVGSMVSNSSLFNLLSDLPSLGYYGQSKCMDFNQNVTSEEYLSSYHKCLKAGCSTSVKHSDVLSQLYTAMTKSLPVYLQYQFWIMVQLGQVRADNWKAVADKMKAESGNTSELFGNFQSLSSIVSGSTFNGGSYGVIPFRMDLGSSMGNRSTATRVNFGFVGSRLPSFTLSNIASMGSNGLLQRLGLIDNAIFERDLKVNTQPCQYKNIVWPNLPPLNGSFQGCCDHELCYTPRISLMLPIHSGVWSYLDHWSQWSTCTHSCGGGSQERKRHCVGKGCGDVPTENRSCNSVPCPYWLAWSNFGPCSRTCGGGLSQRMRFCAGIGNCTGNNRDSQPCRVGVCPTFNEWSAWSSCNVNCGVGLKTRNRTCLSGGAYGCPSQNFDVSLCNDYCGSISYTDTNCNTTTCYVTRTFVCKKSDGSPGFCHPDLMTTKHLKCYDEHCYCYHFPTQHGCVFRMAFSDLFN